MKKEGIQKSQLKPTFSALSLEAVITKKKKKGGGVHDFNTAFFNRSTEGSKMEAGLCSARVPPWRVWGVALGCFDLRRGFATN